MKGLLQRITRGFRTMKAGLAIMWGSPYESANWSPRRGAIPGSSPTEGRRELTPGVRSTLVQGSRYTSKSSGFIKEMVGNMSLYSVGDGIRVQPQSGNQAADIEYLAYWKMWCRRCEITNRFSLEEVEQMICRATDVDGEIFVHKTRDRNGRPVLQLLETHRVQDGGKGDTSDGIILDDYGAPVTYRVMLDNGEFKDIPDAMILHVFEPESVSLVRNAPSFQHSINNVVDEMELLALEKHAVKDNSDITRVLKLNSGGLDEDDGDFKFNGNAAPDSTNPAQLQNITGGKVVTVFPGESIESFQPQRPSPTFTGFLEHLRRDSALGVLPYEFAADSSSVGGAGVRLVVAKADRRFSWRQFILIRRFIEQVWFYVIGDAIARKLLTNQPGWWNIACVTPRRITVDAGREAQQNRADVETGLKTLTDHYEEQGSDFAEEMERRAREMRMIMDLAKKYDVPLDMLWKPSGSPLTPPEPPDEPPLPTKSPRR